MTMNTFQLAGERGIGNSHGLSGLSKQRKQEEEEKPARLSSQQEGMSHKPNHKGYKAPEKKYQQEIKNRYP